MFHCQKSFRGSTFFGSIIFSYILYIYIYWHWLFLITIPFKHQGAWFWTSLNIAVLFGTFGYLLHRSTVLLEDSKTELPLPISNPRSWILWRNRPRQDRRSPISQELSLGSSQRLTESQERDWCTVKWSGWDWLHLATESWLVWCFFVVVLGERWCIYHVVHDYDIYHYVLHLVYGSYASTKQETSPNFRLKATPTKTML